MFNGRLKITICGAKDLRHTDLTTRHDTKKTQAATTVSNLEPYVAIDVDEVAIESTSTKMKTKEPMWNETFTTDLLRKSEVVGLTVWHDATIPPDDFVANCSISLGDLIEKEEQPLHDLWVSHVHLQSSQRTSLKGRLHSRFLRPFLRPQWCRRPTTSFAFLARSRT
jgi:novel protein kinase C epsilon type